MKKARLGLPLDVCCATLGSDVQRDVAQWQSGEGTTHDILNSTGDDRAGKEGGMGKR